MRNLSAHIAIALVVFAGVSCQRSPTGPYEEEGTIQFRFEDGGPAAPAELAELMRKAGLTPNAGSGALSMIGKSSASTAITEARVLVLDCAKWPSEAALLLALSLEPDSLYDLTGLDPRRDVWENLLAIFKGYKGRTYLFAGEYALSVQGGTARGVVSVRPGLNIFFAVLREGKQTVYVYSTLTRVLPVQNSVIALSPSAIVKTLLNNVAVWDSSRWNHLGAGTNGEVNALAVSGPLVYAGGSFTRAGNAVVSNMAVWNTLTSSWSSVGTGTNGPVSDLLVQGSDVYAVGAFTSAGGVAANNIARWNGTTWSAVGSGVSGQINAITASGTSLFVGGNFASASAVTVNNVAEWNGTVWSAMNNGTNGPVFALAPTGTSVIVGGSFGRAGPVIGGVLSNGIAVWNGSWSGLSTGVNTLGTIRSLAVAGSLIYGGGFFSSAGNTAAGSIAVWNGSTWQGLAGGVNGSVRSLAYDPADSSLYVGGVFLGAGSTSAVNIARYKAGSWLKVGAGLDGPVNDFAISGRKLYVGGSFKYNY